MSPVVVPDHAKPSRGSQDALYKQRITSFQIQDLMIMMTLLMIMMNNNAMEEPLLDSRYG